MYGDSHPNHRYLLYSIGWSRIQFGRAAALALIMAVVNWILIMARSVSQGLKKEISNYEKNLLVVLAE